MRGFVLLLVLLIISGAIALSGGIFTGPAQTPLENVANLSASSFSGSTAAVSSGMCCDSGNGSACVPDQTAKTITYKGQAYGLLKSNITMPEAPYHLAQDGTTAANLSYDANMPIVINTSMNFRNLSNPAIECGKGVQDQLWGPNNSCVSVAHNEFVYVCKSNCSGNDAGKNFNGHFFCGENDSQYQNVTCYGSTQTVYDVFMRLSDYPNPGVPDFIKNCSPASGSNNSSTSTQISTPNSSTNDAKLQMGTFSLTQSGLSSWTSPFCKPAIYLYPKTDEFVNVKVRPIGGFYLTIPTYPQNGWDVFAKTDGTLLSGGFLYDYLYYETKVPDKLVIPPSSGYVEQYDQLSQLFSSLLPKLGLNPTESQQFSDYWLKALPESKYYFVGVMPLDELDEFSRLQITPSPDTVLRVTLYFKPLNKFETVSPPVLPIVSRSGFTVVEWGGIYKKDQKHPFSCLM